MDDDYIVTYTLNKIYEGATVHLEIMNQRGQIIKTIGEIGAPTETGTQKYTISKAEFQKNDGIIVEYRTKDGQVLTGLAQHIINPKTEPSTVPSIPLEPETPELPDFSNAFTTLKFTASGENYIITYALTEVYKDATMHLEIMNQRGQIIKTIGVIGAPTEAGTQKYIISKAEFQKGDGVIMEYKTSDGQILTGAAKHIMGL
ncbi:hypothetical protein PCORN_17164 [Listeria cornellensis FSL F6-0969]|uniref:Uncharacterized protein n=1 Tax=Listeria cornellensis FSL F6-0969 TaxID=1265820 RepID=W7BQJ0_9LIST|nr:hypothetical protein PCORN_17164 [Listeria cornellensis FSL F6-0969]